MSRWDREPPRRYGEPGVPGPLRRRNMWNPGAIFGGIVGGLIGSQLEKADEPEPKKPAPIPAPAPATSSEFDKAMKYVTSVPEGAVVNLTLSEFRSLIDKGVVNYEGETPMVSKRKIEVK